MRPIRRPLLTLLGGLAALLLALSFLYMLAMRHLEGEERTFWQALTWASGTVSTTGYGGDTEWRHPVLVLFAVVTQFAGVVLVFLVVPMVLVPFLEERFERRPPRAVARLSGHIVVLRSGAEVESLAGEAERAGVPVLYVEDRESEARRLVEAGARTIFGTVDDGVLEKAHLQTARAFVANGGDDLDAAAVLAARQLGFAGEIVALIEEPRHRRPLILAGATKALTPRHLLAAALAARASERISPTVSGLETLGGRLHVRELRLNASSELVEKTLRGSRLGARTGTLVLGVWRSGRLLTDLGAETELAARDVLVAAGDQEGLRKLSALAGGTPLRGRQGRFVVAGYGEVGGVAVELLRSVGEEVLVVDRRERPGVDLVGDFLDLSVLERAGASEAQGVILALDSDSATLFATVLVREAAPDVPIVARVNQSANVGRIHRAGADFALSISQVSGQILAGTLLGQDAVEIENQLRVVRAPAEALAGRSLAEVDLRRRFGCTVVALERGEEIRLPVPGDFRFAPGDRLYLAGNRRDTRRCLDALG